MTQSADQALAGGSGCELPDVSVPPLWDKNPYLNVDRNVVRTSNLLQALKNFNPSTSADLDPARANKWPRALPGSSPAPALSPHSHPNHPAAARPATISADGRRKPMHVVPTAEPIRFIPGHGVSQRVSRLVNRNTTEANRLVWNPLRATIAGQGTEPLEEGLRGVRLTLAVD
jgi:hypothetical protein